MAYDFDQYLPRGKRDKYSMGIRPNSFESLKLSMRSDELISNESFVIPGPLKKQRGGQVLFGWVTVSESVRPCISCSF